MINNSNNKKSSSRKGFTLVELLVVIAIIGILSGFMMQAFIKAQKTAKKTTAVAEVKALEQAFKQYFEFYQAWPSTFTETPGIIIDKDYGKMLMGVNEGAYKTFNPKGMNFMEFARFDESGNPINIWRGKYYAKFDTDYNNVISAADAQPTADVYRNVIVWCDNGNKTNTYIKSW